MHFVAIAQAKNQILFYYLKAGNQRKSIS